jgi:hypothetical protein
LLQPPLHRKEEEEEEEEDGQVVRICSTARGPLPWSYIYACRTDCVFVRSLPCTWCSADVRRFHGDQCDQYKTDSTQTSLNFAAFFGFLEIIHVSLAWSDFWYDAFWSFLARRTALYKAN